MSIGTRITTILLAFVALAGFAAAQDAPCPECDADGESVVNNYHSIDLGVITNDTEVLGDTDLSMSHTGDDKGFWTWLQICLSAWVQNVEHALGVDLGLDLDANAEVYADSDGVDVDATLYDGGEAILDFDESAAGDLDGASWQAIASIEGTTGADLTVPAFVPELETIDVDVCVNAEIDLVACG